MDDGHSLSSIPEGRCRGRGARSNRSGRYEAKRREDFDDGWSSLEELPGFETKVQEEAAKRAITKNNSPDIGFDQSVNPYRGCEHGCSYCYARPTHCFMGLSAGLDFETQLFAKLNAPELLERELAVKNYVPKTIALGTNTDPYQPIEKHYGITRRILEVLERHNHPVSIVTKSILVARDIDIMQRMAKNNLVKVTLSVTTLDRRTARKMEPRASAPHLRTKAIQELSDAGVPTAVMMAPIVPAINDHEIEQILETATDCGANEAGYVMLRLPLELKELFREWLWTEFPNRADRVMSLLHSMRGGRDYEAEWGLRQIGRGPYAEHIGARFRIAVKRHGLKKLTLRTDLFKCPERLGDQKTLF